jgi:hypothetical protein
MLRSQGLKIYAPQAYDAVMLAHPTFLGDRQLRLQHAGSLHVCGAINATVTAEALGR